MAATIRARPDLRQPRAWLGKLVSRMMSPAPLSRSVTAIMRRGPGSVDAQFEAQAQFTKTGGRRAWKPSQRVLRDGGLTLVLTGAYRRAWAGRGSGGVGTHRGNTFRIGVSRGSFPQVRILQGSRTVRGVVPRRVGVGKVMLERNTDAALDYYVRGRVK